MPYDENIQTFAAMFTGYDQALSRLEAAVKEKEPTPAFIALFEALNGLSLWMTGLASISRRRGRFSALAGGSVCEERT